MHYPPIHPPSHAPTNRHSLIHPVLPVHCTGKYAEGRFVYEGEFDEDAVTGSGKFSYPSGASYEGQWVGGLYSGKGRYAWPDGRSYEVCTGWGAVGSDAWEGSREEH